MSAAATGRRRALPRDQPQAGQPPALSAPSRAQSPARHRRSGARDAAPASGPDRARSRRASASPTAVRDRIAARVRGGQRLARLSRLRDPGRDEERRSAPGGGAPVRVLPDHARGEPSRRIPMTSVELNRELGAFVLERVPTTRVDLERSEVEIARGGPARRGVRVRSIAGRGRAGCRSAPSGTVAALLSGGIDSPVAAWRMMKRGCRVVFVHFHSVPYLPPTSQAKARALVERLTRLAVRLAALPGAVRRDPARGRARRCRRPPGSWSIGA